MDRAEVKQKILGQIDEVTNGDDDATRRDVLSFLLDLRSELNTRIDALDDEIGDDEEDDIEHLETEDPKTD